MKNWSRLILPLGLGALATFINVGVMNAQLTPIELVSVKQAKKAGEKFTEADFVKVEVGYPSSHLSEHFFEWEERTLLLNQIGSPRELKPGSLIPKTDFANFQKMPFEIPERGLQVGFRLHSDGIEAAQRRLLIPGRDVLLRFQDEDRSVLRCQLVYLQEIQKDKSSTHQWYQVGVVLPDTVNADLKAALVAGKVNQLSGISDTNFEK